MFRALLFPPGEKILMEAPIAITLLSASSSSGKEAAAAPPPPPAAVPLSIQSEAIFTTAVGHSSKRTLARWHVTTPQEILEQMLDLVKDDESSSTTTTTSSTIETATAIVGDV
jgi:trehalose 6-phosphate synthase/phosphatase